MVLQGESGKIAMTSGDYALEVLPALGGALAGLSFQGVPLLRRAPLRTDEPLSSAAFALVPYANRIAHGRFRCGARAVHLAPNAPGQRHPLHGQGWRAPWRIEHLEAQQVTLVFEHAAGQWPWQYVARQRLSLDAHGLEVALSLHNRSAEPMPAGLGWHPYFRRSPRMRLRAALEQVWLTDAECLPTQLAPGAAFGDWAKGEELPAERLIDHCYTGWQGLAELEWPEEPLCVRLRATAPLRWLHLYLPPGEAFVCLEPVSHMPDALNRPERPECTGVRLLEPGATFAATIRLSASRGLCAW